MASQPVSSVYSRSYNSFSGVDIKCVFGNVIIGEIQAISYSITREKAPIYTMGSADPRSFSRGKRGIAGTLIFIMFDRHAILGSLGGYAATGGLRFQSDIDDIRPEFTDPNIGFGATLTSASGRSAGATINEQFLQAQESEISSVGSDQQVASAWYADQIPPFDITLAAANEYGALAVMRIFGAEILNEGYGVSIDDIVSEQQHTYIARTIIGWHPVASTAVEQIASQGGVNLSG